MDTPSVIVLVAGEVLRGLGVGAIVVALHMVRIFAALAVLPPFGDQLVNTLTKGGIAMILALFVAVGQPALPLPTGFGLLALVLKEVLIGVALGFAMSTLLWAVEFAGALIDNAAGYNNVQLTNPMSDQASTPVSDMMMRLAGACFFAVGGAVWIAGLMFDTFQIWPVLSPWPSAAGMQAVFIDRLLVPLFSNTVKLAAPILIVLLLVDVATGLLSRSADKLEPASLGQPIKGLLAILMVLLLIGAGLSHMIGLLVSPELSQLLRSMAPAR